MNEKPVDIVAGIMAGVSIVSAAGYAVSPELRDALRGCTDE